MKAARHISSAALTLSLLVVFAASAGAQQSCKAWSYPGGSVTVSCGGVRPEDPRELFARGYNGKVIVHITAKGTASHNDVVVFEGLAYALGKHFGASSVEAWRTDGRAGSWPFDSAPEGARGHPAAENGKTVFVLSVGKTGAVTPTVIASRIGGGRSNGHMIAERVGGTPRETYSGGRPVKKPYGETFGPAARRTPEIGRFEFPVWQPVRLKVMQPDFAQGAITVSDINAQWDRQARQIDRHVPGKRVHLVETGTGPLRRLAQTTANGRLVAAGNPDAVLRTVLGGESTLRFSLGRDLVKVRAGIAYQAAVSDLMYVHLPGTPRLAYGYNPPAMSDLPYRTLAFSQWR